MKANRIGNDSQWGRLSQGLSGQQIRGTGRKTNQDTTPCLAAGGAMNSCSFTRSPHRRGRAASAKRQAKSCGRSEGSSRIALCRIELYIWLKQARAWDKVCLQTNAVGVLEQHRIVTRCPCPLLRAVDYDGPHLSK